MKSCMDPIGMLQLYWQLSSSIYLLSSSCIIRVSELMDLCTCSHLWLYFITVYPNPYLIVREHSNSKKRCSSNFIILFHFYETMYSSPIACEFVIWRLPFSGWSSCQRYYLLFPLSITRKPKATPFVSSIHCWCDSCNSTWVVSG